MNNSSREIVITRYEKSTRVEGYDWIITFNRNGLINGMDYGNLSMMPDGSTLRPNFWRAATENDWGAALHRHFAVWREPSLSLQDFDYRVENNQAIITTLHDMPDVSAQLHITYTINGDGEIKVSQRLLTTDGVKVPNMFRYGMRMEMNARYNIVEYYGRGNVENYSDRKSCANIGVYRQSVNELYNNHMARPQESGTRSDLRYYKITDTSGAGLRIIADTPFSASALPYSIEALDLSRNDYRRHSGQLQSDEKIHLCFDLLQQGVGCINSWGAWPLEPYRVPYQDYTFNFIITPLR